MYKTLIKKKSKADKIEVSTNIFSISHKIATLFKEDNIIQIPHNL